MQLALLVNNSNQQLQRVHQRMCERCSTYLLLQAATANEDTIALSSSTWQKLARRTVVFFNRHPCSDVQCEFE
jgi:hypothetical protein